MSHDVPTLAARLGISQSFLDIFAKRGDIRSYTDGGKRFVDEDDARKLIQHLGVSTRRGSRCHETRSGGRS